MNYVMKPPALKREHPARRNIKFLHFFSFLVDNFCPSRSSSGSVFQMRIRIQPIKINGDHCTTGNDYLLPINILQSCWHANWAAHPSQFLTVRGGGAGGKIRKPRRQINADNPLIRTCHQWRHRGPVSWVGGRADGIAPDQSQRLNFPPSNPGL